jgi:hypothetical protein
MEQVAHSSSGRRAAIGNAGALVVSVAALATLLVLWAVASHEPRGTNYGSGFIFGLTRVSPFGLVGVGLLLALVLRSRLLLRRDAVGTWFVVACLLIAVQLLLACWAWAVSRRTLHPAPATTSAWLTRCRSSGSGLWSHEMSTLSVASGVAGRWAYPAVLVAGIVGAGVLVLGMSSFAFVLAAIEAACSP